MPTLNPVTNPDEDTVATLGGVPLHVPPGVVDVRLVLVPTHIPRPPVIPDGPGFTTTTAVAWQPVANK